MRVRGELDDSFDGELKMEMEIDDERLQEFAERPDPGGMDRIAHFKKLFRLQGEFVKLQAGWSIKSSRLW